MKISHFPDLLPDETIFSVCCRYLDRMQFRSHSIVSQHFFGRRFERGAADLPSSLDHLIQALPPNHSYTVDAIINNHTLFPLYAPFLPVERALRLKQHMITHTTHIRTHSIAGTTNSSIPQLREMKYCPACVDFDRVTYGECYWHREHQF